MTVLMHAIGRDRLALVKYLVEQGAALHLKDAKGRTALDRARRAGDKRIVAFLEREASKTSR